MVSSSVLISPEMEWRELAKILRKGDLVEFSRGSGSSSSGTGGALYKHWAVYVGILKGVPHVIHYSNEDLSEGAKNHWQLIEISGNVEVQSEALERVACGCRCRKNNGWDATDTPLSPELIVKMAKQSVGITGYNLVTNNCEHFAHFCRYGKARSGQVISTMTWIGIATGVAGAAVVGAIAVGKAMSGN